MSPDGTKVAGIFDYQIPNEDLGYDLLCDNLLHFTTANKILIERLECQSLITPLYPVYQYPFPTPEYAHINQIFFAPDNTTLYLVTQYHIMLLRWVPLHTKVQRLPPVANLPLIEYLQFNASITACYTQRHEFGSAVFVKIQAISDLDFQDVDIRQGNR